MISREPFGEIVGDVLYPIPKLVKKSGVILLVNDLDLSKLTAGFFDEAFIGFEELRDSVLGLFILLYS